MDNFKREEEKLTQTKFDNSGSMIATTPTEDKCESVGGQIMHVFG